MLQRFNDAIIKKRTENKVTKSHVFDVDGPVVSLIDYVKVPHHVLHFVIVDPVEAAS